MTIKRSLKQLFRTPVTAALFFLLFAVASFFFSCGLILWGRNQAAIQAYEEGFVTVGTVRQKATALEQWERWDAETQTYTTRTWPQYASVIPVSALDFEGAGYLLGPEKRPYYGAWSHDLRLSGEGTGWSGSFIAEVTPLEDCVPAGPVKMRVEKVIWSYHPLQKGDTFWLCDHFNDNPQTLFADKTYIMSLQEYAPHKDGGDSGECIPSTGIASTQVAPERVPVSTDTAGSFYQEVTEGFYQGEDGKRWLELAKAKRRIYETLPVWPTGGTHLLPAFFNGSAFILEGEDITAEEYAGGERVCLISQSFARNNGLSPGDSLRLPLYYADYRNAPIDNFSAAGMGGFGSLLNAEGELYPIFSDREYRVKGIYRSLEGSGSRHGMGTNTVVIPAASVEERDTDHILNYGPMKDTTTSFQIPNGSIESFIQSFLERGDRQAVDSLEFAFYDRGYSKLQQGLDNMKRMSLFFLAFGTAMALALVLFFCYLFITKQRMRTAVERMLGMNKGQCAASLLSGFFLVAALAILTGCAAGFFAEKQLVRGISSAVYYDTTYTMGQIQQPAAEPADQAVSPLYAVTAGGILAVTVGLVSAIGMGRNLRQEPLRMLGSQKE